MSHTLLSQPLTAQTKDARMGAPMSNERTKLAGEALLLAVYLFADFRSEWPISRSVAIGVAVVGVVGLVLAHLGYHPRVLVAALVAVVVGIFVLKRLDPVHPAPTVAQTGPLRPGVEPTPPNGCDLGDPGFLDKFKIIYGRNAISYSGQGHFVAVTVGACPVLAVERTPAG